MPLYTPREIIFHKNFEAVKQYYRAHGAIPKEKTSENNPREFRRDGQGQAREIVAENDTSPSRDHLS